MSARPTRRPPVRIVQPKRTHAEVPWDPPYHYDCTRGHRLAADRECCACPVCDNGVPCDGTLRRVGPHGGAVRS